jgi:hypothetical protein
MMSINIIEKGKQNHCYPIDSAVYGYASQVFNYEFHILETVVYTV